MRILSVDDSKTTRDVVRNVIDVLGFEFLEASDGKEALDVLEREKGKVDLVLLDVNMPVMDGIDTLKAMKDDARFKDVPVTMVTMEIERDTVVKAVECGARNYLMKPFTQEELVGKIMESLGLGV